MNFVDWTVTNDNDAELIITGKVIECISYISNIISISDVNESCLVF